MKNFIIMICSILAIFQASSQVYGETKTDLSEKDCLPEYRFDGEKLILSVKEWEKRLTPEQFMILRKGETETPFKNAYYDNKEKGIYVCAGCGLALYSSNTKFDSGTGWPSFWQPICPENVTLTDEGWIF